MEDLMLTTNENIQVAIIFLKMFDLILESKDLVSNDDYLLIYNSSHEPAGKLFVGQNNITINANLMNGVLAANFAPISFHGHIQDNENTTYAKWKSTIKFTINSDKPDRFIGSVSIDCLVDSLSGNHCSITSYIKQIVNDKKTMALIFHNEGNALRAELFDNNDEELIVISPFDRFGNYCTHVLTTNKKKDSSGWDYRKGISLEAKRQYAHELLELQYVMYEGENFGESKTHSINKAQGRLYVHQMGELLREYDPRLYQTFQKIEQNLSVGKISLFDSFIKYSLSHYLDAELSSIFGIQSDSQQAIMEDITSLYFGHGRQNKLTQK